MSKKKIYDWHDWIENATVKLEVYKLERQQDIRQKQAHRSISSTINHFMCLLFDLSEVANLNVEQFDGMTGSIMAEVNVLRKGMGLDPFVEQSAKKSS